MSALTFEEAAQERSDSRKRLQTMAGFLTESESGLIVTRTRNGKTVHLPICEDVRLAMIGGLWHEYNSLWGSEHGR